MKKWTIDDSKELYNINGWGTSYFGVNDKGDSARSQRVRRLQSLVTSL